MEILDLLALIFCVLAVVMNAAAVVVLLKKKTGQGAAAHSVIFASFSFIFLIVGCTGYLFSSYATLLPATIFLSGVCMVLCLATEKARPPLEMPELQASSSASLEDAQEADDDAQEADELDFLSLNLDSGEEEWPGGDAEELDFSSLDIDSGDAEWLSGARDEPAVYSLEEIIGSDELEGADKVAAEMQNAILPKELPDLPEAGFGFFFQPADGSCDGYCDAIFARRDRVALVAANVSGRGVASAMGLTGLRAILRLVTNTTRGPATILDWVNKGMTGRSGAGFQANLSFASYSLESRKLEYSSAGRLPMLVWRAAEKKAERVLLESDAIGSSRAAVYMEKKLEAAPGDIIALFTEGLAETPGADGGQYGLDGLSRTIAENADSSAKDIAAAVGRDLAIFSSFSSPKSDRALLVMKIMA